MTEAVGWLSYIQFADRLEVLVHGLHQAMDELENGQFVLIAMTSRESNKYWLDDVKIDDFNRNLLTSSSPSTATTKNSDAYLR